MIPVVAQPDRAGWQLRAAVELARILESNPGLPRIAWTVGPSGSVVVGRVSGLAPASLVRGAFLAWRQALGLADCGEQRARGSVILRAADRSGEVTIRLAAIVIAGDEDTGEA